MSARPHGELDKDAFDVGLDGLRGDLQLLGNTLIGESAACPRSESMWIAWPKGSIAD